MLARGNFNTNLPDAMRNEVTQKVAALAGGKVVVERIVTEGQASPKGFWYDQAGDEWVMVLAGGAVLEFDEPVGEERLGAGDWVLIPARRRHRVRSALSGTLWLAVYAMPISQKEQ